LLESETTLSGTPKATNRFPACENNDCFSSGADIEMKKNTTSSLSSSHLKNPRIMIYIKPWDSTVFENFFVFLKTIQDLQEEF